MYWFNSFKLITGLLPPSFFFTINVLLRNWSLCGQAYSIAPYFTRFSTSNEASAFSCISKFICFGFRLFFLVYFLSGIRYPLTNWEIFWFFISFSQLPRKFTNLPVSGTVGMFKLQNNLFTNWFAHENFPISISVEFLWRRLLFWLLEFLNCTML